MDLMGFDQHRFATRVCRGGDDDRFRRCARRYGELDSRRYVQGGGRFLEHATAAHVPGVVQGLDSRFTFLQHQHGLFASRLERCGAGRTESQPPAAQFSGCTVPTLLQLMEAVLPGDSIERVGQRLPGLLARAIH